jgi:hypothetical protein
VEPSIKQIIETAAELDGGIVEDFLYDMQKQSNLRAKVFFGLLNAELDKIKKRDREEIEKLERRGLIIFYKYFLLDILIDGIFEKESSRIDLTPQMAKVLGYNIVPNTIDLSKTKKPLNEQRKTSYKWENNPDKELFELFNLMISKFKLISLETTYDQFKSVFTMKPLESIKPIKWHQDNASELLYFIERLEQSDNIIHNPKRSDYQKLKACFVKPDGTQFKVAWKSLKTNIELTLSPEKQKAIDELVSNF